MILSSNATAVEIVFPEECVGLNFVGPPAEPKVDRKIDPVKLQRWKNSHAKSLQPIVDIIARNIQYVTHTDFLQALRESLDELAQHLQPNKPTLLWDPTGGDGAGRSNRWVLHLALDTLRNGKAQLNGVQQIEVVETLYGIAGEDVNIVAFDDATYGASSLGAVVDAMPEVGGNRIAVVPYATEDAKDYLNYRADAVISVRIMPTVGDYLGDLTQQQLRLFHSAYGSPENFIYYRVLTYFQHRTADHASTLEIRDSETVLDGAVPTLDGRLKAWIPFIPDPEFNY